MEIQLRSTDIVKIINGVECRIWEGVTTSNIPILAFVARIGVEIDHDQTEFLAELKETRTPTVDADSSYSFRLLI
jgi:hypothetical protein